VTLDHNVAGAFWEIPMKITVIKTAAKNAKPSGVCTMFVDDFPMNKK